MADSLAAFPVFAHDDFRGAVLRNENQQKARAFGVSQQSHAGSLFLFCSVQVN
jgi:hypothetical protein